jgi:hypothetical protein
MFIVHCDHQFTPLAPPSDDGTLGFFTSEFLVLGPESGMSVGDK